MNARLLALTVPLAAAALVAEARPARADLLSLRAEVHGGGATGAGVGGTQQDEAFHAGATGAAYGALLGVEIAFIDVWVDHHQFTDGDSLSTWTQFMTGLDLDFVRKSKKQAPAAAGEPAPPRKTTGYVEIGLALGFGVGTGRQVEPPLSNDEITDKGFLLEAKLGTGIAIGSVLSVGVSLPVSAGYFFKNQGFANDADTHYYGVQGALLLVVRGKILVK